MPEASLDLDELIQLNGDLENYFNNTVIPQVFVDANFILRKFTPPAMKHFDLSGADIGRSIFEILSNFRFPSLPENIKKVIESNEILEKEIQTTDLRWYQMNILPYIVRKSNQTNGVIITFVDISRRVQDLKDQEKLIAENELLLDTISHDIKTPLTNLKLLVELFKSISPDDTEEFQSLIKMAENSLAKMQRLITDLTSSRLDDYKNKLETELVDFGNIIEDARLALAASIYESGAIIKTALHVSELTFSRRKLRSIVYNLLANAVK